MKKKIILSCICFTILTFLVLSNADSINAMTIEETSEEHIVGNLVLDNNIDNSNQKIIITTDDIDFSISTVKHMKLDNFLLVEEL